MPARLARLTADPRASRWSGPALLGLLTLLGLALRLYRLWRPELTFDEGATWFFSGRPLADLWSGPAWLETNPPLFYTLVYAFRALGAAAEDERLISVAFGTACIPLAYLLAGRLAGRFAGVGAALLLALSAAQIGTSQDARAYAGLTAAALLALVSVQRLLAGGGAWAWAGYVLGALAALYLHDTAVLLVAACNLVVLLAWPAGGGRGFLWRWVLANLVILVGYAPWIGVVVDQSLHELARLPFPRPTLTGFRYEVLNTYALRFLALGEPFADMFFIGLLAVGVVATRRKPFARALVVAVVVGVPVASFLISQWRPIMNGKTFLCLIPFGLVFVAAGCAALRRARLPALLLAAGLETAATLHLAAGRGGKSWSAVAGALASEARDGEALVVAPAFLAFMLDHYGLPAGSLPTFSLGRQVPWFPPTGAPPLPEAQPLTVLAKFPRVWEVTTDATQGAGDLRARLACAFVAHALTPARAPLHLTVFERRAAPTCR